MKSRRPAVGLGLTAVISLTLPLTSCTTEGGTSVPHACPRAQTAKDSSTEAGVDAGSKANADTGTDARLQDDFNGDGYADVAFVALAQRRAGQPGEGYVAAVYGSPHGLRTSSKQVFDRAFSGPENDLYGDTATSADLNRDGYADLIVGSANSLTVTWGSARGLAGPPTRLIGADVSNWNVVAGDFNGDGSQDVATVTGTDRELRVLTGPFRRDGTPTGGVHDVKDREGLVILDLAAGDVNGDGITDLVSAGSLPDEYDQRMITCWPGTHKGLAPNTTVERSEGRYEHPVLEGGEGVDIGDVNGDGYADVVVGRPVTGFDSDPMVPHSKGGMITYLPGGADGLDARGVRTFNQDSAGVPGVAEDVDEFGSGLSVGDIDGDGYADVSVGVPHEQFDGKGDAGRVVTMYGTAHGLTGTGARILSEDTEGVSGVAEEKDLFGSSTKLVDTNGDGRAELLVGAYGENRTGMVWALRSTATGITPAGSFTIDPHTLGTTGSTADLGLRFDGQDVEDPGRFGKWENY